MKLKHNPPFFNSQFYIKNRCSWRKLGTNSLFSLSFVRE